METQMTDRKSRFGERPAARRPDRVRAEGTRRLDGRRAGVRNARGVGPFVRMWKPWGPATDAEPRDAMTRIPDDEEDGLVRRGLAARSQRKSRRVLRPDGTESELEVEWWLAIPNEPNVRPCGRRDWPGDVRVVAERTQSEGAHWQSQ